MNILKYIKNFLHDQIFLVIFSALIVLFVYGIKIFNYNIGIDTDLWLAGERFLNHARIGRFGCILLKSVWSTGKLNIYTANFFAALFLLGGALLWCILFDYYNTRYIRGGV